MRILFLVLLIFSPLGLADTWQQANKDSVAFLKAGKLSEAEAASKNAIDLYKDADSYSDDGHVNLVFNYADVC